MTAKMKLIALIGLFRWVFAQKDLTEQERHKHLERLSKELDPIELYHPDEEIRKIAESVRGMRDLLKYGDDDLRRLGDWGMRFLAARTIGLL